MSEQDSIFFRNFSLLLGGLVVLTIILAIVGYSMHKDIVEQVHQEADRSKIQKSIEPVAEVNTDPNAVLETAQTGGNAAPFDGSTDGQLIYDNVCFACHSTGAGGAPKLETAAWTDRMDKGTEALIANAINGFQGNAGLMPAKGGRADLTDEQVAAAVQHMLDSLQ